MFHGLFWEFMHFCKMHKKQSTWRFRNCYCVVRRPMCGQRSVESRGVERAGKVARRDVGKRSELRVEGGGGNG